jgi:hypothetical protein
MGLCTLGLSGGTPVVNQQAGVTLLQAGDFATIQLSGTGPGGGDNGGVFAPGSGPFTNAEIVVQFVANQALYGLVNGSVSGTLATPNVGQNGIWSFLANCVRSDTNAFIGGPFYATNSAAFQISLPLIQGYYAVRLYLLAISSGSILVSGNTTPETTSSYDAQIYQALLGNSLYNNGQLLADSNDDSTDYRFILGGGNY